MAYQGWGSDVPVSMPVPPESAVLVSMFGFAFTIDGLFHDITQADADEIGTPTYAPIHGAQTVFDGDGLGKGGTSG